MTRDNIKSNDPLRTTMRLARWTEPAGLTEEHVRQVYGSGARRYDQVMDTAYPDMVDRRRILDVLAPDVGDRVLEVGIGTGKNVKYYPGGVHLQGTDFTPAMLGIAKRNRESFIGASLNLTLANTEALPYDSASFDKILACLTICVTPNPSKALSELLRVAKPRARIVLYEMHLSPDHNTACMQHAMVRGPAMTIGHPPPSEELPGGVIVWDPCRDLIAMTGELGFVCELLEWYDFTHPVLARCLMSLRKPEDVQGRASL